MKLQATVLAALLVMPLISVALDFKPKSPMSDSSDFSKPPSPGPAGHVDLILGGDEGDACKMILCLSDPIGNDLVECAEVLDKYHRMRPDKRPEFLRKCPVVGGDFESLFK